MIKLFKEALKTTNDCIILAIPLLFFLWIISFYLAFSSATVNQPAELILATVTLLFMAGAFMAGWFYMVKKAIGVSKKIYVLDEDRSKATINLFKEIPTGIGMYFLSFIGMALIFLIIASLTGALIYKFGMHFIGSVDFTAEQLRNAVNSPQDMKTFFDSLSLDQLLKLNNWNLLFMAATSVLSFLIMLWIPEIIYCTSNPLIALFRSIKKLFSKFGKFLVLFIFISVLNFVISFISTFAMINPFIYLFIMIIYIYFLVYVVVLIFCYYEKEFCEQQQTDSVTTENDNKQA